jgi:cardiolipin synthase
VLNTLTVAALVLHLAAAGAAGAHVLYHYRRPAAAVAWLFALLFLPFVGAIVYVMIAIYGGPRAVRRRRNEARAVREARRRGPKGAEGYRQAGLEPGLGGLMDAVAAFPLIPGNRLELIADADEALDRQLAAIRAARREVLLQTYVLKPGMVLDRLAAALREAVAGGARVRVLIDPIGSQELPNADWERFGGEGIRTATFLTPNPLKGRFQVNFRNHRKSLLVDRELAFTGGRNWADEYYPGPGGGTTLRDTTALLHGPAALAMRRVFAEDWAIATADTEGLDEPDGTPGRPDPGDTMVRVLPFGPDEPRSSAVDVLGGAFRAARRSILVVTPYFVPGSTLAHDLRSAALSGIEVLVLIPERCERRSIDLAARSYFEPLLDAGVTIRRLAAPMLHSKAVIVDGIWSTFGSVNFDARSLHLNYELNLEVLGEAFAADLRAHFDADLEAARAVDPAAFRRRGTRARLAEKAAALFEPLM